MKYFTNLLLTILVCIGLSSSVTYTGNYTCRRVRVLDSVVHPPPGVNPQALFYNIWSFLQSSKITPEMLAQSYPRLSDVAFKNFSDHQLSEKEYDEFVNNISKALGVTVDKFPNYSTYLSGYGTTKSEYMMGAFKQEFISVLNKSGDMEAVFKMVKGLYIAQYLARESEHMLIDSSEIRRQGMINLYAKILRGDQNLTAGSRNYNEIEGKDFIIKNGEEVVTYSLAQLFITGQQEIDDLNGEFEELKNRQWQLDSHDYEWRKQSIESRIENIEKEWPKYAKLIQTLCDGEKYPRLQKQMQSVRTRIENMLIDKRVRDRILSYFPQNP